MEKLDYTLIRSPRKTISIQLSPDGSLVVRAPNRMPKRDIEGFVESKRGWIEGHLKKLPETQPKLTDTELQELARHAKEVLPEIAARRRWEWITDASPSAPSEPAGAAAQPRAI